MVRKLTNVIRNGINFTPGKSITI